MKCTLLSGSITTVRSSIAFQNARAAASILQFHSFNSASLGSAPSSPASKAPQSNPSVVGFRSILMSVKYASRSDFRNQILLPSLCRGIGAS